jgi:hypothetical protein
MNKTFKIILNILIFAVIAGFGYYVIRSMSSNERTISGEITENTFVSPYTKIDSMEFDSDIICFDVYKNTLYVAFADRIDGIRLSNGEKIFQTIPVGFELTTIPTGIRDMVVDENFVYILYPTKIIVYSNYPHPYENVKTKEWEACSDNSDYVAIATSEDYVFVTDAADKNIVQYTKQGGLVRFIKSPEGFIIPSHTFDIININDTIFVANSGRHKIESYTLNGEFISSFGKSGAQAGAFAGCCNPVYLAATSNGNILTSEKGNPRISSYGKDGNFRMILFDSHSLGGGTDAYRMRVSGENIYIASRKTISVYEFDATRLEKSCNKSCGGCKNACPKKMNN